MLLPLGTDRPLRRPTLVTFALIAACLSVHVMLETLWVTDKARAQMLGDLGALRPGAGFHWWGLVTHAFLHANWQHVLGNMVFLFVFGPNIEDRFGRIWFLAFYLVGAAVSGATHVFYARVGVIGASGAIAACTGAYLVMFPRTNIRVLFLIVPQGFWVSAWWFIGGAIVMDIWGASWRGWGLLRDGPGDNVAHLAHLSGYAYGALVALLLLWLKIVPREPFDLFTIGRQAYRRRQFKEAGVIAEQRGAHLRVKPTKVGSAREGEAHGGADAEAIAAARADVVTRLGSGDMDGAARAYKELADRYAHVPAAATLSRRWQYQLANHFYQVKDHDAAAFAYQRFLEAYPGDGEAGHIRLLLGLIHARALNDPVKAKALISEALKTLEEPEANLARRELEALG